MTPPISGIHSLSPGSTRSPNRAPTVPAAKVAPNSGPTRKPTPPMTASPSAVMELKLAKSEKTTEVERKPVSTPASAAMAADRPKA
ncbi:hypothetical protein SALBM311S_00886 [Streptomyces alboniger]